MKMDIEATKLAQAGYQGMMHAQPAYDSSPNGLAFAAGQVCRKHGIEPKEVTMGRGYKVNINRCWTVDLKDASNPILARK